MALKSLLSRIYSAIPLVLVRAIVRLVQPRFSVSMVGAFFAADGTVLLLRHVYRHRHPWGLPAGFLSVGERPEAGILRELSEETGMRAQIERTVSVTPIARHHLEIALTGAIDRAQVPRLNHEIFEAAFFAAHDLPAEIAPEQRALIMTLASSRGAR